MVRSIKSAERTPRGEVGMHRRESLETGLAQALENSPDQAELQGGRGQCWKNQRAYPFPQVLRVAAFRLFSQGPESCTLASPELAVPGRNRRKTIPGIAVGLVGHGKVGGAVVC